MSNELRNALIALLHTAEKLHQGVTLALAGDQAALKMVCEDFYDRGCAATEVGSKVSAIVHQMRNDEDEQNAADFAAYEKWLEAEEAKRCLQSERK